MADEFDLYFVQTLPISLQIRGRFDRTYSLEILSRNLLVNKNICHAIGCLLALADAYPHKSSSFSQFMKTISVIKMLKILLKTKGAVLFALRSQLLDLRLQ